MFLEFSMTISVIEVIGIKLIIKLHFREEPKIEISVF